MRCRCCDRLLSDYESTRKDVVTGEYLDMCNKCFCESDLPDLIAVDDRDDLVTHDEEDGHNENQNE